MTTIAPAVGHVAMASIQDDLPQKLATGELQWQAQGPAHFSSSKMNVLNAATCSNAGPLQKKVKTKRKSESLSATLCAAIVEHQLGLSINCLLLLAMTHALFPSLRPRTGQFFMLSYHDEPTGLYHQGWDDFKFVTFWIVVFTALRAATMDYVLIPLAKYAGVSKKKATIRFAEQAWLLIYYAVFWTLGAYLMYQTPYWFNLPAVWDNFPNRAMTGMFKWYYLAQFAFWIQQIVVVNIEERRKDHWQMFTHHIITCALMFGSYGYYQTKVGNTILCLMDVVDLLLPAAKLFKYTGYQTLCDLTFVAFIVTWIIARHVFYLAVCWSIYVDVPQVMHYGCYNAVTGEKTSNDGGNLIFDNIIHAYTNAGTDVCFNERIHYGFLGLLLALQVITLIWLGMIFRVAYGVIMGKPADDSRSDDEGEEEEEELDTEEDIVGQVKDFSEKMPEADILPPQEVEVEAEEIDFVRRPSPSKRRSKGRSSGISIPGAASDHKELLGRIGCDKPS
ncbi:hypothetical protein AAFC00_000944 [Neodothiora populina]|uniref:TLC domain-containing protein n=1 Tax=Neodothiora populina TaxID=2781224 RepID=A0ABR3PM96_9PEZI